MRCMPGASHIVFGPFVRSPGGIGHLLNFLSVVPLAVVVALAVGSAAQARFGEEALVELALLSQGDFRLEDVDLARQSSPASFRQAVWPTVSSRLSFLALPQ